VIAARQKVQHFLTAACVGNLDLLKSKFFTFLFFPFFFPGLRCLWWSRLLCIGILVIWGLLFYFLMLNFDD